ncbi:uncharacterized protein LOC125119331 [Phacochoerus africanus]|uniref:uncharacterized protein LOC125119331 n=1 Tax=Phacochoerus africanus TaxID=41426 RepID=UPI001FD95136|nr:uncharacterized protein LOC125119331 [Phacochoerus africanus]
MKAHGAWRVCVRPTSLRATLLKVIEQCTTMSWRPVGVRRPRRRPGLGKMRTRRPQYLRWRRRRRRAGPVEMARRSPQPSPGLSRTTSLAPRWTGRTMKAHVSWRAVCETDLAESNLAESDRDSVAESTDCRQDEEAAAMHDDVVEAGGSEKTEEEARAGEDEDEAAPVPEVEEEEEAGRPRGNGQQESPAIARAEPDDEPGPKVDGADDESSWSLESVCETDLAESNLA